MRRVLIIGGYGAVGREAAAALTAQVPEVVVAGRAPGRARPVAGAVPLRLDAGDGEALARALDGTEAVLMCAERHNAQVARACLERGVHYIDVSASYDVLASVERLDGLAARHDATAVLSVGLVPGVSNLLARHCAERSAGRDVEIGVLIGAGEHHGRQAMEWTLDGLARMGPSWRMPFPAPYGSRTVHRFPFSDQHTLPASQGVRRARTGLCLDSRALTALLPRVARLAARPRARAAALAVLGRVHAGGDGFAVAASSGESRASFAGRRQSRASGLAAALVARRLDALPPGVRHIDEVIEPEPFLAELAAEGFDLDLGAPQYDAR